MSDNFKKAPKLLHNNSKCNGNFYKLSQKVMDSIFNKLDGKNGNAIKIMVVLLGTNGNGTFRISEEFIKQRTGITKQNYHRTMKYLESIGFIKKENKVITIDVNYILSDSHHDDYVGRHDDNCSNRDDDLYGAHDDYYNIKE